MAASDISDVNFGVGNLPSLRKESELGFELGYG